MLRLSYLLNMPFVLGGPEALMVEPSGACNLRCPLCPTGLGITKREKYLLSAEEFERALGWFRWTLRTISFWNYGEPFMNRDLAKMIAVASRYRIRTFVSSNGTFVDGPLLDDVLAAGLTQLNVSIDTPHKEFYANYRVRGDFDRVERNIRRAVERKRALGAKTEIVAQYMLMSGSEDVDAIIAHGMSLGVDKVLVKTIGIGSSVPKPSNKDWAFMPERDENNRYASKDDLRVKIGWDDKRCQYIWGRMVLTSDGQCVPCCRDQMAQFKLGSVADGAALPSVWNAPEYRRYRRHIRETQKKEVMCQRCPEVMREAAEPGFVFTAPPGSAPGEAEPRRELTTADADA
jgi:radical SAM protein with 4Fe4S-binding SPASM domain